MCLFYFRDINEAITTYETSTDVDLRKLSLYTILQIFMNNEDASIITSFAEENDIGWLINQKKLVW